MASETGRGSLSLFPAERTNISLAPEMAGERRRGEGGSNARRLKVLFSEGSSLSARHTLYALGPRHIIDILDPNPSFCLARFSRFVRRCYRCPRFAVDPFGYLDFVRARLKAERYDVLFPVHDQAYLLSRSRDELSRWAAVPVPEFAAMERVQSKSAFMDLLAELGLPHPHTRAIHSRQELEQERSFPFYLKLPYGTAGCGVWRIEDAAMARTICEQLESNGTLGPDKVALLQQAAPGVLGVAQAVFQHGRLLAAHTYQARALGVGGSARARVGVDLPQVREHLRILGEHLRWHGALMLDFLVEPVTGRVAYIEANPRIGETVNALLSGVNLPELLLSVGLDENVQPAPVRRHAVRTHSLVMSLMALAQNGGTRVELLRELCRAAAAHDIYAGSQDEVTRPCDDALSMIPAAFVALQLLVNPRRAQGIVSRAVRDYALSALSDEAIRRMGTLSASS
jgi:predicted ATP-grasp superfamily ATP-dependent carboligase